MLNQVSLHDKNVKPLLQYMYVWGLCIYTTYIAQKQVLWAKSLNDYDQTKGIGRPHCDARKLIKQEWRQLESKSLSLTWHVVCMCEWGDALGTKR